jgi:DNA polymerase-1
MSDKTIIIDGDMIIYRAAFSSEVETKWDDNIWTLHSSEAEARAKIDELVEGIIKKLDAKEYITCISGKQNFRRDLFQDYKANRSSKRKPLGISDLTDYMYDYHNGLIVDNLEADDLIGILCTRNPKETIAVSGDKDFGTLPITWYNHLKDKVTTTSVRAANKFHLVQTLTGDAVDGYNGLKGVGIKTAHKILDKYGANWKTVVEQYEKQDLTEEDALLTARLAYILRNKDYNLETKKIKLWTPRKPRK